MENKEKEKEFDLRKLWWVLRKYLLWILIAAVLGGVALGVYTTMTTETTYTTQSVFLVGSEDDPKPSGSATTDYYKIQKAKEDAIEIVEVIKMSTTVTSIMTSARNPEDGDLTPEAIQKTMSMVSAKVSKEDSRMVVLSVTSPSAEDSLTVSMAFEMHLPTYITGLKSLEANLEVVENVSSRYFAGFDDAGEPTYNVTPDKVPLVRNALLGAVIFAVLVYLILFVYDSLDNTIRTTDNLIERFPEIPVLGQIPEWVSKKLTRRQKKLERMGRLRDYDEKLLNDNTSFSIAESFRGLRTNISYVVSGKTTVIGVTSTRSGECKSVAAANLALCYAQLKKKVLLVEGDMRLPSQHDIFNINPVVGLPEVLAGIETDYHGCIHHHNEYLDILPVGAQNPPNPSELLASDATVALFAKLRAEYDLIILDLPPVGVVSDASIVSDVVDQYLISTRLESTNARVLDNTLREMQRLNMKVCGFVISGQSGSTRYANSPYYYDQYGRRQRRDAETAEDAAPAEE